MVSYPFIYMGQKELNTHIILHDWHYDNPWLEIISMNGMK